MTADGRWDLTKCLKG